MKEPLQTPRLSKRAISIRECEALAEHRDRKALICMCFNEEDSSEDDIDNCILAELAVLKASMQKIGHMMGILKGLVNDYVMQACDAILKQVIKWPSIEELRNISGRIRKVLGFINCIGLIDGT